MEAKEIVAIVSGSFAGLVTLLYAIVYVVEKISKRKAAAKSQESEELAQDRNFLREERNHAFERLEKRISNLETDLVHANQRLDECQEREDKSQKENAGFLRRLDRAYTRIQYLEAFCKEKGFVPLPFADMTDSAEHSPLSP